VDGCVSEDVYLKFDKAEQVERVAAKLYRQLAERFSATKATADTLSQLAAEEDQHAMRVRMLRDRYAKHPSAFEEVPLDLALMDELLAEAELLAQLFAREPFTLTVAEAREFMIKLEQRFASAHAQSMAVSATTELSTFFEALAKGDREHAKLLASLGSQL
jgi:rubrerythrin